MVDLSLDIALTEETMSSNPEITDYLYEYIAFKKDSSPNDVNSREELVEYATVDGYTIYRIIYDNEFTKVYNVFDTNAFFCTFYRFKGHREFNVNGSTINAFIYEETYVQA